MYNTQNIYDVVQEVYKTHGHCYPRGIPNRYTQEIYFALQDIWGIPLALRGYISWITYAYLLGIIFIPLGVHSAPQEVCKSCYPRGMCVTQEVYLYLLGYTLHTSWVYFHTPWVLCHTSWVTSMHSKRYDGSKNNALQDICLALQDIYPRGITCCPRHMTP